jgi:hypothetical protein
LPIDCGRQRLLLHVKQRVKGLILDHMTQPWQLCKSRVLYEIIQNIHAIKSRPRKASRAHEPVGRFSSFQIRHWTVGVNQFSVHCCPTTFSALTAIFFVPAGLGAVDASSDKSGSPPHSTLTFPRDFSISPSKGLFFLCVSQVLALCLFVSCAVAQHQQEYADFADYGGAQQHQRPAPRAINRPPQGPEPPKPTPVAILKQINR